MTLIYNKKISFLKLFKVNFKKRSDKAVGAINEAISALYRLNDEILISIAEDRVLISEINSKIADKKSVLNSNDRLIIDVTKIKN